MRAIIFFIALFFCFMDPVFGQVTENQAIKILIGEAANQGEKGMQAVAEVLRRRGSVKGFVAFNRPDIARFIEKQPQFLKDRAIKAWRNSAFSNMTNGATHYENVEAFGEPWWVKKDNMKEVAKVGDHTFYKK